MHDRFNFNCSIKLNNRYDKSDLLSGFKKTKKKIIRSFQPPKFGTNYFLLISRYKMLPSVKQYYCPFSFCLPSKKNEEI